MNHNKNSFWRKRKKIIKIKTLFKVPFQSSVFLSSSCTQRFKTKKSTNFDDIDKIEVSKIIFVNFCIHF